MLFLNVGKPLLDPDALALRVFACAECAFRIQAGQYLNGRIQIKSSFVHCKACSAFSFDMVSARSFI